MINDDDKNKILKLFNDNVKGKEICLNKNNKHCGKEGHWLEKMMDIKHNSNNSPDLYGYEMKKYSKKITLGDFSASEYAFSDKNKRNIINEKNNWTDDNIIINKKNFIHYFGNPNISKNNRYSWSGSSVPTYNKYNNNGQILLVENNDIVIYYSHLDDTRDNKDTLPEFLKTNEKILIAIWLENKMTLHINNKFNQKGFFICKKIDNKYEKICFGKPFNFEYFIECIKNKKIIFDSGMYDGNNRNYSHFRGYNFLDELIIEEY